ncbi:MAG: twin-arginine translocase TatA/TatE family subunit [Chloroflexota bacterium]|nr:twin-arginine translocase TatA/TatE family subunit [Chloroflexota bacterium]
MRLGPWELIAILAIVLIIFGAGKLPNVAKSLGEAIKEFRKSSKGEEPAAGGPPATKPGLENQDKKPS